MARSLFIPVHLHARLVTATTGPTPGLGVNHFSDDGPALAPGVHLHWALPDALTRSSVEPDGQAICFSALPDRWLVIRFAGAPALGDPQVSLGRRTCTAFVVDSKAGTSGRLGNLVFKTSSDWLTVMGLLPEGRKTAAGGPLPPDVHLAAAYYPTAAGRFGFHDDLKGVGDLATDHLSYLVIGYYRSAAEDPLGRLSGPHERFEWIRSARLDVDLPYPRPLRRAPVHEQMLSPARRIDPSLIAVHRGPADPHGKQREQVEPLGVLAELGLQPTEALKASLERIAGAVDVTAELSHKLNEFDVPTRPLGHVPEDTTGIPARIVCHGAVVDLGPGGAYTGDSDLAAAPSLALADSASAAIEEAFVAIGGGELFAVLRGGLDGEIAGVTGTQSLPHLLHAAGFDAAPTEQPVREYVATITDSGTPTDLQLLGGTLLRVVDRRSAPGAAVPAAITGAGELTALRAAVKPAVVAVTLREVPPPRWHRPGTPVLRLEGHGRSFRHGHDGRMSFDGRLKCRAGGQLVTALELAVATDLASPTARITASRLLNLPLALTREPDFVRALIDEAVLLDPTNRDLAASAWLFGLDANDRTQARAEAARQAFRNSTEGWWTAADPTAGPSREVAKFAGTLPVPFAVTPWREPWLPLHAEVQYRFTPRDKQGAALEWDPAQPLEPRLAAPTTGTAIVASARQVLASAGPASLKSAIERVKEHFSKVPERKAQLDALVVRLASLDMLTFAFSDLDPQLRAAGHALRGGELRLEKIRLIDTFGQVREPAPIARELPPRLTHWARVNTRLVEAGPAARDADPLRSPLCGFLVFDAVEQALELFAANGAPLGQIRHDRFTHQASWETAPGRDGAALMAIQPPLFAEIAQALLAPPTLDTSESAVAAVLRVLDRARIGVDRRLPADDQRSTLVRRPALLLRARLTLEVAGVGAGDRPSASVTPLLPGSVPVRLGSLDQADDGLLGFFFRHPGGAWKLHVVPGVASSAWQSQQIVHPIVDLSTSLALTPGVATEVILVLDGPSPFHVQSGVLPRKRIEPGELVPARTLAHLQTTLRVGPVVMDPTTRRLAAPDLPGDIWRWVERDRGEYRDYTLAPFSPALSELPDRPVTIREGWLRLDPDDA